MADETKRINEVNIFKVTGTNPKYNVYCLKPPGQSATFIRHATDAIRDSKYGKEPSSGSTSADEDSVRSGSEASVYIVRKSEGKESLGIIVKEMDEQSDSSDFSDSSDSDDAILWVVDESEKSVGSDNDDKDAGEENTETKRRSSALTAALASLVPSHEAKTDENTLTKDDDQTIEADPFCGSELGDDAARLSSSAINISDDAADSSSLFAYQSPASSAGTTPLQSPSRASLTSSLSFFEPTDSPDQPQPQRLVATTLPEELNYTEALATALVHHKPVFIVTDQRNHKILAYYMLELSGVDLEGYMHNIKNEGTELTLLQRLRLALSASKSLQMLFAEDILHRDITTENVMVSESGKIKFCDFGSAKVSATEEMPYEGNPRYRATELKLYRVEKPTQETEIYSFGIVLARIFGFRLNLALAKLYNPADAIAQVAAETAIAGGSISEVAAKATKQDGSVPLAVIYRAATTAVLEVKDIKQAGEKITPQREKQIIGTTKRAAFEVSELCEDELTPCFDSILENPDFYDLDYFDRQILVSIVMHLYSMVHKDPKERPKIEDLIKVLTNYIDALTPSKSLAVSASALLSSPSSSDDDSTRFVAVASSSSESPISSQSSPPGASSSTIGAFSLPACNPSSLSVPSILKK